MNDLREWCNDLFVLVGALQENRLRHLAGPPAARDGADVHELLQVFVALNLDITDPGSVERETNRLRLTLVNAEIPAAVGRLKAILEPVQINVADLTTKGIGDPAEPLVSLDGLPGGVEVVIGTPHDGGHWTGLRPDRLPADHPLREVLAAGELYRPAPQDMGVLLLGPSGPGRRLYRLREAVALTRRLAEGQRKSREDQARRDAAETARRQKEWEEMRKASGPVSASSNWSMPR